MAHALLSPSAAGRWLHCTAAPLLEACQPEETSEFADEGTFAHAVASMRLQMKHGMTVPEDTMRDIARLHDKYYSAELEEYVSDYVQFVSDRYAAARQKNSDAILLIEQRLDLDEWIPKSFGTADAIIITDGIMEVIDLKYGRGVAVSAVGNAQMRIYALGAYDSLSAEYAITDVRMTIYQPRIGNYSEDTISVRELRYWGRSVLRPRAWQAIAGGTTAPGEWCQFCRMRSKCRALAAWCLDGAERCNPEAALSVDEIAALLPRLDQIKKWADNVQSQAQRMALEGTAVPGYKLVEGRSVRTISDPGALRKALNDAGYGDDRILRPVELRTLGELERVCGKKTFATEFGQYLTRPTGKPTLVPESDKRPPLGSAADFDGIDTGGHE